MPGTILEKTEGQATCDDMSEVPNAWILDWVWEGWHSEQVVVCIENMNSITVVVLLMQHSK